MPKSVSIAKAMFVIMAVATVLNGMPYWFKRVGWTQPELYRTYRSQYASTPDHLRTLEEKLAFRRFTVRLHETRGSELLLKGAKDLFLGVFLTVSVLFFIRKTTPAVIHPLLILLASAVLLSLFYSCYRYGSWLPLTGLRGMGFVLVAIFGSWACARKPLEFLSFCLIGLVLVQVVLAPIEWVRGMHLFTARFFGTDMGDRMVGTMIFPIGLGVLSVVAMNFATRFVPSIGVRMAMVPVTVFLVFLSASATAWGALLASFLWYGYDIAGNRARQAMSWIAALAVLVMAFLLPWIVARPDIYDSLWGRLSVLQNFPETCANTLDMMFGKGLGTASNFASQVAAFLPDSVPVLPNYSADSTPLALLHQFGVVGCSVFYGLLGWAAWRDAGSRSIYLTIVLASVTMNVHEFFPVNFILGLMLCRSFSPSVSH